MTFPKDIAPGQASSDLNEALSLLESWKALAARCREVGEISYTPTLRVAATALGQLANGAVQALQGVFDSLPHAESAMEATPLYTPQLPQWRPGGPTETGD